MIVEIMSNFYYMLVITARCPNRTKGTRAQYVESIVTGLEPSPKTISEDEVEGLFREIP
jgi:hypothetical protein